MSTHLVHPPRIFIDAGHHDIVLPDAATRAGEPIDGPNGSLLALTTPASLRTFQHGVKELLELRARGIDSTLGVFIGDLAIPRQARPNSAESLAPSFRSVLKAHDLSFNDVEWVSEATARNRGKKLIDRARHRYAGLHHTYQNFGWALCSDGEVLAIVSDRTLEGSEGLAIAVLTRGQHALCPAILIGHKHLIARAGYTEHIALYSKADDPFIGRKLWAAALVVEALSNESPQLGAHVHITETNQDGNHRTWRAERHDLTGVGEVAIADLEADLRQLHPTFTLV